MSQVVMRCSSFNSSVSDVVDLFRGKANSKHHQKF